MPSRPRVREVANDAGNRAGESRSPAPGTVSVRRRMTLLLALTVSAFTVAFFLVQHSLDSQLDMLVRERVLETTRVLRRILDLRASGASVHADDYTRWDDFVAFARKPDPRWGQLYLTENIGTFGIDVAWVLDDRFRLIFTANPKADSTIAAFPAPPRVLALALSQSPVRHFFAATPRGVMEIWTSSIEPSSDPWITTSLPQQRFPLPP